jgi:16S rRNA processing protein RimM
LHTDFPERFAQRTQLCGLGPNGERRELQLESFWPHKGRIVFKFRGVDSITAAEQLAGWEVQIPAEQRVQLEPGAVYVTDLLGCAVFAAGRKLGAIEDVDFGAGRAPLLVVREAKKEYLIPFAEQFIERFELAGKRLFLTLPEGLLELDAPLTQEEKAAQRRRNTP